MNRHVAIGIYLYLFTELAIRITKENGIQSFVTPNKILGADYAKALQQVFFPTFLKSMTFHRWEMLCLKGLVFQWLRLL